MRATDVLAVRLNPTVTVATRWCDLHWLIRGERQSTSLIIIRFCSTALQERAGCGRAHRVAGSLVFSL